MIKRTSAGLDYYTFPLLDKFPELHHGVLTRRGPEDQDWTLAYDEKTGFQPSTISNNIKVSAQALSLPDPALVGQVHGQQILFLDDYQNYQPQKAQDIIKGYDALVTSPGRSLMIRLADCQGLIIYDPTKRILALIHNGWRGSVQNIISHTITEMSKRYQLNPSNFVAALSPSLGACCAEFINYRSELPESFWAYKDERDYFDFPAITHQQLLASGLNSKKHRIIRDLHQMHP
jgi:YfiH family protein